MERGRPRRVVTRLVLALCLGAASLAAPALAFAGDPCFHDETRPPVSSAPVDTIRLDTCAFFPTIARIPVGGSVRFLNSSILSHLITGANLAWGSHTSALEPGLSVSYRFDEPGLYPFSCMLHPGMTGAVSVGGVTAAEAVGPVNGKASGDDGAPVSPEPGDVGMIVGAGSLAALAGLALLVIRRRAADPGREGTRSA